MELGCFWHADFFHEAYFVPKIKEGKKSNLAFCVGLWKLRVSCQTAFILPFPGGKKCWHTCATHAHITAHDVRCYLYRTNCIYPDNNLVSAARLIQLQHIAFHVISFQLNCLRLSFPNCSNFLEECRYYFREVLSFIPW